MNTGFDNSCERRTRQQMTRQYDRYYLIKRRQGPEGVVPKRELGEYQNGKSNKCVFKKIRLNKARV